MPKDAVRSTIYISSAGNEEQEFAEMGLTFFEQLCSSGKVQSQLQVCHLPTQHQYPYFSEGLLWLHALVEAYLGDVHDVVGFADGQQLGHGCLSSASYSLIVPVSFWRH